MRVSHMRVSHMRASPVGHLIGVINIYLIGVIEGRISELVLL
jgi:hypothetical protein